MNKSNTKNYYYTTGRCLKLKMNEYNEAGSIDRYKEDGVV